MSENMIRIATRRSPLALWQANHVKDALQQAHPGIQVALLQMTTTGDKILDAPLAKVGGKGLFVKELERALLDGDADIAVHSMKDVPVEVPDGLRLTVIMKREDPRDAFVSNHFNDFDALPQGARLGTSSLRRQCQLKQRRADLRVIDLRGNVNSRLQKLDEDQYDAIILASAGLIRLGLAERIRNSLPTEISLPAIGQGAVGIECRADDPRVNALIAPLDHADTHTCVMAERAMNARLQGGCQVPIAGFAELQKDTLFMRGLVGEPDGSLLVRGDIAGHPRDARELGTVLAEDLLARGAEQILKSLYNTH